MKKILIVLAVLMATSANAQPLNRNLPGANIGMANKALPSEASLPHLPIIAPPFVFSVLTAPFSAPTPPSSATKTIVGGALTPPVPFNIPASFVTPTALPAPSIPTAERQQDVCAGQLMHCFDLLKLP